MQGRDTMYTMIENSMYHMLLRTSALTLALLLLFDSGLLSPLTKQISSNTQQYVATAVGVGASVQPTELNVLTAALTSRDRALDDREAALQQREIQVGIANGSVERSNTNVSTYILSVLLFIILVLIVLNYALDFARERRFMRSPERTV